MKYEGGERLGGGEMGETEIVSEKKLGIELIQVIVTGPTARSAVPKSQCQQ